MIAFIIGSGETTPDIVHTLSRSAQLIIAADGGAEHLLNSDVIPDIALGDFDSCPANAFTELKHRAVKLERHPAEKNETDLELAFAYAIRSGCSRITVSGFSGSRSDHTLANYLLMARFASQGAQIEAHTPHEIIFIGQKTIPITGHAGKLLSIIPLAGELTIDHSLGLKYPVDNLHIGFGSTRGVSNVITSDQAELTIYAGIAAVFIQRGLNG